MTATQHTAAAIIDNLGWHGASGEITTGADTARHLEATIDLLENNGWTRVTARDDSDTGPLKAVRPTWTTKGILLALVESILATDTPLTGPLTTGTALSRVSDSDNGDQDTWHTANQCIQAILRIRTGATSCQASAWFTKQGRTWEQTRDLLREAAELACQHGPRA